MAKRLIKQGDRYIIKNVEQTEVNEIEVETEVTPQTISPIVEETTFQSEKKPNKSGLVFMSKDELYGEILKLNKKDAVTEDFAILITPKIKRSVDIVAHQKWDMAHGHVRKMMKKLHDEGKIIWRQKGPVEKRKGTPFYCNLPRNKAEKTA